MIKRIKELEQQVEELVDELHGARENLAIMTRIAQSWMRDVERLEAKYEPTYIAIEDMDWTATSDKLILNEESDD